MPFHSWFIHDDLPCLCKKEDPVAGLDTMFVQDSGGIERELTGLLACPPLVVAQFIRRPFLRGLVPLGGLFLGMCLLQKAFSQSSVAEIVDLILYLDKRTVTKERLFSILFRCF